MDLPRLKLPGPLARDLAFLVWTMWAVNSIPHTARSRKTHGGQAEPTEGPVSEPRLWPQQPQSPRKRSEKAAASLVPRKPALELGGELGAAPAPWGPARGLAPCPALYTTLTERGCARGRAWRQANTAGPSGGREGRAPAAPQLLLPVAPRHGGRAGLGRRWAAGCCEGGQRGQQWRIFMKALRNSMLKVV